MSWNSFNRMEAKVKEAVAKLREKKLPKAFLEAHTKWHTRKHQMHYGKWCSCNFCVEKWAGTRFIGHTPFPFMKYKEEIGKLKAIPCHNLDPGDIAREIAFRERRRKRDIVRKRLRECKEEVL